MRTWAWVSCRCACRALFIQVLDVFWMFPAASRFSETKEVCSQRWQIFNKSWASNHVTVWMFPTVGDRKLCENIHKGGYKRFHVGIQLGDILFSFFLSRNPIRKRKSTMNFYQQVSLCCEQPISDLSHYSLFLCVAELRCCPKMIKKISAITAFSEWSLRSVKMMIFVEQHQKTL